MEVSTGSSVLVLYSASATHPLSNSPPAAYSKRLSSAIEGGANIRDKVAADAMPTETNFWIELGLAEAWQITFPRDEITLALREAIISTLRSIMFCL